MILFEKTMKTFLATMSRYFFRSYIIDKHIHFISNRKITYEDCVKFIFWNKGRNNEVELTEFLKVSKGKKYETLSHQAIGKQRIFIKPELFINLFKSLLTLYTKKINIFQKLKDI